MPPPKGGNGGGIRKTRRRSVKKALIQQAYTPIINNITNPCLDGYSFLQFPEVAEARRNPHIGGNIRFELKTVSIIPMVELAG